MPRLTPGTHRRWLPLALAALGALGALAAAPRRAEAQPDCVAGTVASYVALGATGCKIASVQFTGFDAQLERLRAGFTTLDLANASFAPLDLGGGLTGLRLTLTRTLSSFGSNVAEENCTGGLCNLLDQVVLNGGFRATGLGGDVIRGVGIGAFDLATAAVEDWNASGDAWLIAKPGFNAVHELLQAGDPPYCAAEGAMVPCVNPVLGSISPGLATMDFTLKLYTGVSSYLYKPGEPTPPGSASASFAGIDYLVLAGPAAVVPEPGSVALVATGLLGMLGAALRRRA